MRSEARPEWQGGSLTSCSCVALARRRVSEKFEETEENCYELKFEASINIDEKRWDQADKKFKECAENGLIEVEFDIENNGDLFEFGDHFEKQTDGQTEMFID